MKRILLLIIVFVVTAPAYCQIGNIFKGDDANDTIFLIELDSFSITARPLKNYNYSRYESIVKRVYPYADTAIMQFNKLKAMEFTSHHDEKKYKKELEDQLRDNFESTLKNFTRSQGAVMIDIIERNTGKSMYDILKDVKSGSTAFWWQNLGKVYGYDLKSGYDPEDDPTLEKIIADYELKYKKK